MKQKSRIKSTNEFVSGLASGLRLAATRPNIHGYRPHEKQQEFHASVARKRLFTGGNRSGKTVGGAVECVFWLMGNHPYLKTPRPPVRGRAVSVDLLHGVEQIVKPEIARWLPPSSLIEGSWEKSYDRETRILSLQNGSSLEFMSYEQDIEKFAGTSRHFIWFDEEPPREIYEENTMRLLDTGGSLWFTMTPTEGMTWVYDEIYMAAKVDEDIFVVEVDMTENPHINYGEVEAFLAGLTSEEKEARLHGKFIQIGGLIYKMFDREKHIIEPFTPPTNWLHVGAMDHGFNNPTAWLWAAINPDGDVFVFDEHYESGRIVAYHAQKVHEIDQYHERVPDYYVGDPSIRNVDPITGTSVQLEYVEYGVPICLGNNDLRAGLNRVARYLTGINGRPKLYITKNCVNLLTELPRLRWSTWSSKKIAADKNKKEEQHKKNDHACDALRYLISSRPEYDDGTEVPKVEYGPRGFPEAVNANNRVDEELLRPTGKTRRDYTTPDFYLGGEW
jgi:phage terminase large subunit-like protein